MSSLHLKSSKPKEKNKTKENITLRNGDTNEKDEQQLDRSRMKAVGRVGQRMPIDGICSIGVNRRKQYVYLYKRIAANSAVVSLNIHKGESEILRYNAACNNPITIDGENLEDLKNVTILGSIIDEHGRSDAEVKARIGRIRAAYLQLKGLWEAKQLPTNTEVRIFRTNVKTLLLQNTLDPLTKHYQQQATVKENKPDSNGGRDQEEALKVDRTHIEKGTRLCHKTSPQVESSRLKEEKKKTKEHIMPENGDRHEEK
ncbi:unnamed protein product [Schistosoma margrebowiei]|uniref:Uncharacterized protein n=1 Tax=Schistosoma margrebowiei TaxID=48269 RepID=A0A183N050_9TREM|nr:unnamed protein product [Schistosoma margrebowiei]